MSIREAVGRNFASLRKAAGLTQEEVAERSGLSQQYISDLERGKRNPTVESLVALARAMRVEPRDFLAGL